MQRLNVFLLALSISLLIVVVSLFHALKQHPPYALQIGASSAVLKGENEANSARQEVISAKDEEGSEFWPPFFGLKLKITDSLLALFTGGLLFFTGLLWLSTDKLWAAGERQLIHLQQSSAHQLRAYVYLEKTFIAFENGGWRHSFNIKNFGQTPAHNVRVVSRAEVVDWNNEATRIPAPTDVENLGSMAPYGDFFENEPRIYGHASLEEIVTGTKAIYLVGTISYSTVFSTERRFTDFRYYVGGDTIYEAGEMYADDEGNNAT